MCPDQLSTTIETLYRSESGRILATLDFGNRIESFSIDNIARRLARALIRFSERLGHVAENGSVQMIPFTHELLSQIRGNLPRNCDPLYDPVPAPGVFDLFAQRHPAA